MTPNRSSSSAAVHRADLVDKLVNDSDSDTDLDLPDPSTILSTSSPIRQGPDAAVTCVPETPPSLLFSSREDTQQNLTPKSSQQRVTTTYSAKNSPRAATSSRRSLNANLDMQQENGNGSPTRKRRREALLVGASSLTAVNGSSIIDDADRNITVSKDAKAPQSATPRRGRKRTLETAEKKTSISQTPQRKKTTSNKDINAAAENKCADTNGVALRLLTTGLSDAQLGRLRRATKQIKQQQLASTIDIHNNTELLGIPSKEGGYTHLIAAVGKDGRASRTFKYLTALTSGAWLVTVDWLLESAKACKLLPEANFAVMGDCALPQYSLAGPRPVNELLCKYQIHLWPSSGWDSSAHSQADLQRLIRSTGAEIIDALPVFEDTNTAIENAATSDLRGEALDSSGARHSTGSSAGRNIDREIKTVPTKYRWLFELPVCESSPVVLVDTSSLKGARSNIALGNIVSTTGGTIPCRTKSWLFDCISANIIL
ncbi:BRCA1-associated RING domain protein 1 [Coemansia sp. RSA 988]|nr:BRCA1-associated RING domain protein 1 [Coemansia sp. RSA 988]